MWTTPQPLLLPRKAGEKVGMRSSKIIKVQEKITWLDFLNPTHEDIEQIKKIGNFHPIVLAELLRPSAHPKAEVYDGYIFFSYHLPLYDDASKVSAKGEIDFVIAKDHVITVHYQPLAMLDEFTEKVKNNAEFKSLVLGENTGKFVYYLLDAINDFCLRQLAHIEENLGVVNRHIFSNQEHLMLQHISYVKRDILNYFIIVEPQTALLHSFKESGINFWGEEMRIYLANLVNAHFKIARQIENYRDAIESLEETNSQLLNSKTNAVMQRFTILAFLTFPLALFTAIYNVPEAGQTLDNLFGNFWNSFLAMSILTISVLMVFIKKEWF